MGSPLQNFKHERDERWTVLVDVPPWEKSNVIEWLQRVIGDNRSKSFDSLLLRRIESHNRILITRDLGISTSSWSQMHSSFLTLIAAEDFLRFITFLECVVKSVRDGDRFIEFGSGRVENTDALRALESFLARGSKWGIVFQDYAEAGLVERVDPGLTQTAKDLNIEPLTLAWNSAFSVNSSPEKAVEEAQRAIELAASEAGLTAAKTKIYGTLLGDIRTHPDKYMSAAKEAFDLNMVLSMDPKNPIDINEAFSNWFWEGMDLIQKTHPARHASDQTKGFEMSDAAAKQAVLMATLICYLIASGSFRKKQKAAE